MRNSVCNALVALSGKRSFMFLTGDLGFMALEGLQEALGENFINAGISEQNMVSMAAGIALSGTSAWVYSIAPFCYARPFEQIRNDLCLNQLPVKLVANGGGYAYGSMGSTHHALEDYGVLSTLLPMQIFIPAFGDDVEPIINKMAGLQQPSYLRLGKCELPQDFRLPIYSAWRCLLKGEGPLLVVMGPLVGSYLKSFAHMEPHIRPEIWLVSELPLSFANIPGAFIKKLSQTSILCVAEEHVAHGGLGQSLVWLLLKHGIALPRFLHAYAKGHPSGRYGSQNFHRHECGLDPHSIMQMLELESVIYD